jgi:hypothetical protein
MSLRDAIGKDIYIIEENQYTDADLKKMSVEDLEQLKLKVTLKISSLSLAMKAKQADYATGGAGTSKEWYINHKYALHINQRVLPYINALIRGRFKEIRGRSRSISDYFMDEARAFLKPDEFETILRNAQQEMLLLQGGMR